MMFVSIDLEWIKCFALYVLYNNVSESQHIFAAFVFIFIYMTKVLLTKVDKYIHKSERSQFLLCK